MNLDAQIRSLTTSGRAIQELLHGVTSEEARWKQAPEKWSLLEVACHLLDEERDDFRRRIALTFEDPKQAWPPIDPEGWARDRKYNECDLRSVLVDFARERDLSVGWLGTLEHSDWTIAKAHPQAGDLRTGDLLAAWVAHDLLHLRQLVNTRLAYVNAEVAPFSTRYAGA